MMQHLLREIVTALLRILTNQERTMADFTKLNADLATLSAKVDELVAKVNTPAPTPVDEQPAVDQAVASVEAIIAKIPA
jgi:t-SNARE complex subunit (syntaxin)